MLNISLFSTQHLLFFSFVIATIIGTSIGFGLLYRKSDKLSRQFFASFFKRRFFHVLFSFIVLFLVIFSILLFVQYREKIAKDPIKVVSATEFVKVKSASLKMLQSQGYGSWDSVGLLLIDLRSKDQFNLEHIKGSGQYDFAKVSKNIGFVKGVDFVLIVNKNDVLKAKDLAQSLKNNRLENGNLSDYQTEKIYVISDGYEGLKAANLEVEKGGWD